jgi:hypothetical protein
MAALKKAVRSLFGGKVVPEPDDMPAVARKLFLEVVHSLGDDSSTSITKADLYRYLVFKSEVKRRAANQLLRSACMRSACMRSACGRPLSHKHACSPLPNSSRLASR